uniref:Uncharacterized protein n=1 Tax=Papio anubis TaxID=9555 RepID=A0A8I5N0H8_PAPAN
MINMVAKLKLKGIDGRAPPGETSPGPDTDRIDRLSNNRSVMPLDVRGCTRATLTGSACAYPTPAGAGNPLNPIRDGDRGLQLFPMNEEFPVSAGHKLALIKSLPFVHTARRYYRLDGLVRPSDRPRRGRSRPLAERREDDQT